MLRLLLTSLPQQALQHGTAAVANQVRFIRQSKIRHIQHSHKAGSGREASKVLCLESRLAAAAAAATATDRSATRRAAQHKSRSLTALVAAQKSSAPVKSTKFPSGRTLAASTTSAVMPQQQQQQQMQQPQQLLMSQEQQQKLLQKVQDKPPVIFYHYPCPDGVFAALAATLFFKSRGVTPRYVPHEVYRAVDLQELQLQPDDVAFLLDYSGPDGFPQQLAQHVGQVVVLDHHKTAAEQLCDTSSHPTNLAVCLDMQRSGATIARDFFQPGDMSSSLQDMFRWVEDADLWRWALPDSSAFHAGLSATKLDWHVGRNPAIWQQLMDLDVQQLLDKGVETLKYQEQLVADAVAASKPYQLGGAQGLTRGWGCCMGCEVSGDLIGYRSRLGNSLAQHSKRKGLTPVGLVAYVEDDMPNKLTHVKVSLRSIDDFDTSAVTAAFGGGGHAAASSCIIPTEELLAWQDMGVDGK